MHALLIMERARTHTHKGKEEVREMKGGLDVLVKTVVILVAVRVCSGDELRKNFYKDTCSQAEQIVQSITWKHVASNATLPAKLLRMHFHDCFVGVIKLSSSSLKLTID